MIRLILSATLYLSVTLTSSSAFTVVGPVIQQQQRPAIFATPEISSENTEPQPPQRNPDRPELPAIPGDYDWDAKYKGDDDWITGEKVPGKKVMNEIDLAKQVTALGALEEKWRKERLREEYDNAQNVGFVPLAELINGRTAMFFLVTGLLTELWTGISLPGQVEEMLRIGGFIGFD